jgi:hypothetical protein
VSAGEWVRLECRLCGGRFSYRKPWGGRPQGPQCQCNPNTWGNWKVLRDEPALEAASGPAKAPEASR